MSADKPTKIAGSFEQLVAANSRYGVDGISAIIGGHRLENGIHSLAAIEAAHQRYDILSDKLTTAVSDNHLAVMTVGKTLGSPPFATKDIDDPDKVVKRGRPRPRAGMHTTI